MYVIATFPYISHVFRLQISWQMVKRSKTLYYDKHLNKRFINNHRLMGSAKFTAVRGGKRNKKNYIASDYKHANKLYINIYEFIKSKVRPLIITEFNCIFKK